MPAITVKTYLPIEKNYPPCKILWESKNKSQKKSIANARSQTALKNIAIVSIGKSHALNFVNARTVATDSLKKLAKVSKAVSKSR